MKQSPFVTDLFLYRHLRRQVSAEVADPGEPPKVPPVASMIDISPLEDRVHCD